MLIPPGTSETGCDAASAASAFYMKKTAVYIDALNLYYGSLKGTPHKWLDLSKFCKLLLPNNDVRHIHYFTASLQSRPHDPQKPLRQRVYLRALKTIPNLTITYGRFQTEEVNMPLANRQPGQPPTVAVLKTEEKGSDVNLASRLLRDGYRGCYDAAVIISNDSDLLLAIQIVRDELGKVIGIVNPKWRGPKKRGDLPRR